jgi:hypothetical protein
LEKSCGGRRAVCLLQKFIEKEGSTLAKCSWRETGSTLLKDTNSGEEEEDKKFAEAQGLTLSVRARVGVTQGWKLERPLKRVLGLARGGHHSVMQSLRHTLPSDETKAVQPASACRLWASTASKGEEANILETALRGDPDKLDGWRTLEHGRMIPSSRFVDEIAQTQPSLSVLTRHLRNTIRMACSALQWTGLNTQSLCSLAATSSTLSSSFSPTVDISYRTTTSQYTRDRHQYPAARRYMHTSSVLFHILISTDMQRGGSTAAVYTLSSIIPSRATQQPPSSQLSPTLHNFNVHTMLRHVLSTQG